MSTKDAYVRKFEAQLDTWNAEITKLKAKADEAQGDAQLEYHKQIEALERKQQNAAMKLNELKRAGDNAWEDLKAGFESSWGSLEEAVKSAASRFK